MRRIALEPAARGLMDDAAQFDGLVISHDTIVEGVHYRPDDPPETVGWKLAAVNASDLAAKGATPALAILSLTINGDEAWEAGFLDGLDEALTAFGLPLAGGDTTALPIGAPRVLGMTVIGRAGERTPERAGARDGDTLWLVGNLGDAAAGLAMLDADHETDGPLVDAYRKPVPQLPAGIALARHASAMMDVSDGLLLDAARLGEASGCRVAIDLDALPLSDAFLDQRGSDRVARLFAATGGDDYALLLASSASEAELGHSLPSGSRLTAIGRVIAGEGLALADKDGDVPVPERLGYEHRGQ